MSDFEFSRGDLWPWLLALPVVWALLWLVLDRSRLAMQRYGAEPNFRLATPFWRSFRLAMLLGLGFVCWLDPRWGDETVTVEQLWLHLETPPSSSPSLALPSLPQPRGN